MYLFLIIDFNQHILNLLLNLFKMINNKLQNSSSINLCTENIKGRNI